MKLRFQLGYCSRNELLEKIALLCEGVPFDVFTICNLGRNENASKLLIDIDRTILRELQIFIQWFNICDSTIVLKAMIYICILGVFCQFSHRSKT